MGYGNLSEVNTENERDKEISLVRDISRSVVRLVVRLDTPFVFFLFFHLLRGSRSSVFITTPEVYPDRRIEERTLIETKPVSPDMRGLGQCDWLFQTCTSLF